SDSSVTTAANRPAKRISCLRSSGIGWSRLSGSKLHVHELAVGFHQPLPHMHGEFHRQPRLYERESDFVDRDGVVDRKLADEVVGGGNLLVHRLQAAR